MKSQALLLGLVLCTVIGCQEQSETRPAASVSAEVSPVPLPTSTANLPALSEPQQLCRALEGAGLGTRSWRTDELGAHCASNYLNIGPPGPLGLSTNLAYYVEGPNLQQGEVAKLVLNINNKATRSEGLHQLADAADALFAGTAYSKPNGLREAILSGRTFERKSGAVIARVKKETSRISTYKVEIEDAEAVERRRILAEGAVGLFRRCKSVIKGDLSYAGSLSGDGEPIEEAGYSSFMVEGRGKDLFFCEVYPDGSYKIKAAFDGNYPFKYVSSGTLNNQNSESR